MENKYFTPDISDFYVGYEFQGKIYGEEDEWVNCLYSKPTDEIFCKDSDGNIWVNDSVRVSYLTKEQIEAEGWEYLSEGYVEQQAFYKDDFQMSCFYDKHLLKIIKKESLKTIVLYQGSCRCINDFRKIIKLLGI